MSLLEQFEESEKEVYQVTRNEWVNIMYDHLVNTCKRPINEFNNIDKIEVECYHKEQVTGVLKKGIEVPAIVLNDYVGLKDKIISEQKAKQEKENSIPVFTQDIFNTLKEGNKITVNGYKLTIHKKENKSIIARVYKKQKQAIELLIGERYNIVVGW